MAKSRKQLEREITQLSAKMEQRVREIRNLTARVAVNENMKDAIVDVLFNMIIHSPDCHCSEHSQRQRGSRSKTK